MHSQVMPWQRIKVYIFINRDYYTLLYISLVSWLTKISSMNKAIRNVGIKKGRYMPYLIC